MKKLVFIIMLCLLSFTSSAYAELPENALSSRPDDSVYIVLRLDDTAGFLQWALSRDNLNLFMPLILKGQPKEAVMMISEMVNAFVSSCPVKSAAILSGVTRKNAKLKAPFVQLAFTVSGEASEAVKKIADGKAEASDVARLLINDPMAAAFIKDMIKLENDKSGFYRVNNELFMTAVDDVVVLAASVNDVRLALRALKEEDSRLLTKTSRRFSDNDFMMFHIDYETASELDDSGEVDDIDAREFFDKPLNVEFSFRRVPDKFTVSTALNLSEALKQKYADELKAKTKGLIPVKGGNIDLESSGGKSSPIAALGAYVDFNAMKDTEAWKPLTKSLLRNMRVRFNVTEQEVADLFSGAFSLVVNDTVTYEGFKIPAVYMSQTGTKGAASKVYEKFTKSQHFSKVKDGLLLVDSSLSPVSCLVADKGGKLGLAFAELSSLETKPEITPALSELMNRESIFSTWLDFAALQNWINDDNNGVFSTVAPLASFMGYGKYVQAARDILGAELSVPSVSLWSTESEIFHTEFAVKDIDVNNGLFSKIIKVYQDFTAKPAPAKTDSADKTPD